MSLDPRRLIFIIGPPRAGTTLLSRVLHAHPEIYAGPEPHLITPLAHLGYFAKVDQAPYDPIQTYRAHQALVRSLPAGEQDYLDAMRAFCDTLYGRLLQSSGRSLIVDKTPGYALVLPVLLKIYPEARYLVITRHPFAVWSSYARSFFDDDWAFAHHHNRLLERYIPVIGGLLREPPPGTDLHSLTYEALVSEPEPRLRAICSWLDVDFDPNMLRYGEASPPPMGLGDPTLVDRVDRPVSADLFWAAELRDRPDRRAMLDRMVRHVDDADLVAWGTPREALWQDLDGAPKPARSTKATRHLIERKALVMLRRQLRGSRSGRALSQARWLIDVLLRG